jgi:hypothetical protein
MESKKKILKLNGKDDDIEQSSDVFCMAQCCTCPYKVARLQAVFIFQLHQDSYL